MTNGQQPPPPEDVDMDAHLEIVRGFRIPRDAWESQAKIHPGEELTWAVFLNRHARREARNAHRLAIAESAALLSRSVDAWGSQEAARVAAMRVAGEKNMLDDLLGKSPPPEGMNAVKEARA